MPLGNDGVMLLESGEVDQEKLQEQLEDHGNSVEVGEIVTITEIQFKRDRIELELNGGGKNKKSFWERLEVSFGRGSVPLSQEDYSQNRGSKITLRFPSRVPARLTPDELKQLLDPALDFNKSNFLKTGVDALPPEFKEAVLSKEARIGMDRSTVLMAMGRPDKRVYERVDSMEREDWIYFKRGLRAEFVTFENGLVVKIKQY